MSKRKLVTTGSSHTTAGVPDPRITRGENSMAATQRQIDRKYREWLNRRGLRDEGSFRTNSQIFNA
jgi:hypothetical protein